MAAWRIQSICDGDDAGVQKAHIRPPRPYTPSGGQQQLQGPPPPPSAHPDRSSRNYFNLCRHYSAGRAPNKIRLAAAKVLLRSLPFPRCIWCSCILSMGFVLLGRPPLPPPFPLSIHPADHQMLRPDAHNARIQPTLRVIRLSYGVIVIIFSILTLPLSIHPCDHRMLRQVAQDARTQDT